MSSSRIEQIIEEIEEFVESCRYQPLSTTKIVVNKEELEELLRELRLKTPDEIKRYQKIISNKDAILADAQSKADNIVAEAQAHARELGRADRRHAAGLRPGDGDSQRGQPAGPGDSGFRPAGRQQYPHERHFLYGRYAGQPFPRSWAVPWRM